MAVAAAYYVTWFTQQHDVTVSQFHEGILPGDPQADLLFTVVIRQAFDEIHSRLIGARLVESHGPGLECRVFSAHIVDIPSFQRSCRLSMTPSTSSGHRLGPSAMLSGRPLPLCSPFSRTMDSP